MPRKNNGNVLFAILALLVFLYATGNLPLMSTFTLDRPLLIQYAGSFNGDRFGSESWTLNHPYPLAMASESTFLNYHVITSKEGGDKTVNLYGEPKCLPNTCNGVQTSIDEHGCPVYAGETSSTTSWSVSTKSNSCGSTIPANSCSRFVASRNSCSGYGCVTTSSDDCQQFVGNAGDCSLSCSGTCYTPATCGGWGSEVIGTETGRGCWGTYKVYQTSNSGEELIYDSKNPTKQRIQKEVDNVLTVAFNTDRRTSETMLDCFRIENEFIIKPPEHLLNFTAQAESATVLEGEVITATIIIQNDWLPMQGILKTEFSLPTILGDKTKTETRLVSVPKGISQHTFQIPTSLSTANLTIKPQLDLVFPGSTFTGVNTLTSSCLKNNGELQYGTFGKIISTDACELIRIGTFRQDAFSVKIKSQEEQLISEIISLQSDIAALNATLTEKAAMANELNLSIAQKTELIKILQLDLKDRTDMIQAMTSTLDEKAQMIADLELSIQQQAETMKALRLKSVEQGSLINDLNLTVEKQKELIEELDLNVQQQLIVINNLNINLAEKIALVNRLEITNAEQEYLVSQMRGSFAEQADILDALNLTIKEDASYINQLELSLDAQTGIIDELNLNLQQQAELIKQLDLTVEEKIQLIKNLKLTIEEQNRLIDELKANGGLEPPASQSITDLLKENPLLLAVLGVAIVYVFTRKKNGKN